MPSVGNFRTQYYGKKITQPKILFIKNLGPEILVKNFSLKFLTRKKKKNKIK